MYLRETAKIGTYHPVLKKIYKFAGFILLLTPFACERTLEFLNTLFQPLSALRV